MSGLKTTGEISKEIALERADRLAKVANAMTKIADALRMLDNPDEQIRVIKAVAILHGFEL